MVTTTQGGWHPCKQEPSGNRVRAMLQWCVQLTANQPPKKTARYRRTAAVWLAITPAKDNPKKLSCGHAQGAAQCHGSSTTHTWREVAMRGVVPIGGIVAVIVVPWRIAVLVVVLGSSSVGVGGLSISVGCWLVVCCCSRGGGSVCCCCLVLLGLRLCCLFSRSC